MRIGIITFWESNDNYGQQLQCWALQEYLRRRGHKPFLIRTYAYPKPQERRFLQRIKVSIKSRLVEFLFCTSLAYKPSLPVRLKYLLNIDAIRRRFPQFRRDNLAMSRIYAAPADLVNHPPKADVYITGSDQVWNYDLPHDVYALSFLRFGSELVKRISYAPSVGHAGLPENIKAQVKEYLKSFSAISVREQSAVKLFADLGYSVEQVLDPSMLLNSNDYLRLAKDAKSVPNVFIYSMNYATVEDLPFAAIKTYARQKHLPIIVTPGSGYLPAKELFEGVEYSYSTIPQWIQHIAYSELVVTASFHGIVFAILLHRPFWYTPLKGKYSEGNQRVFDLLKELGLMDRIWYESQACEDFIERPIDWIGVDENLCRLRKESIYFLQSALDNAKKDNLCAN